MVKRKRVSVSWSRGTVRQHQGISGPSREKTRPAPGPSGPSREKTRPARHKPRFLGRFPSLGELFRVCVHVRSHRANFIAPRAQGSHDCETKGITQRPPRYKILPTTTDAHPWRYKTLPASNIRLFCPKCISRENFVPLAEHRSRAGRILYRPSRAHASTTDNKP